MKWTAAYNNDVGPNDEGFWEWWEVTDGQDVVFKTDSEDDAQWLSRTLNRRDLPGRMIQEFHDIEQTLGKALGYPWHKEDQKNFPGATDDDGVCVGEQTAASLADEAAERIRTLEEALGRRQRS